MKALQDKVCFVPFKSETLPREQIVLLFNSVARNRDGHVVFNQVKHFAVRVIGNRSHPFNLVRIDVNGVGSTSKEIRLGRILFHMHDLIRVLQV